MRIGVVSDTHSYLNPRVPELLQGVEHILHAGDIGDDSIIQALARIAPITAVRGNNDKDGPTFLYPEEHVLEINGTRIYLTHQVKVPGPSKFAELDPYRRLNATVVVFGHSHIAFHEWREDILFFNPGAAGKRRFNTVPSIGILDLDGGQTEGTIILL